MMKKWKEIWNRQLVRPLVNRAFTRFILGLAAALVAGSQVAVQLGCTGFSLLHAFAKASAIGL